MAQTSNDELATIAERVRQGMVRIDSVGHGAGAGTVWHPDGLVLTNAHVAAKGQLSVHTLHGDRHLARVLAVDRRLDLAALSVNAAGLTTIELGNTGEMHPGELVLAMGFPWGADGGLTLGVLIGVEADWNRRSGTRRPWVMASLHLRPGHSGGPMVDSGGKLIGINTIMRGPDVGVAIPIETVKDFLVRTIGEKRETA